MWRQGFEGQGVVIGIIDSGIDPKHPDLQNVSIRKTFVPEASLTEFYPHGTHIAGTIAGNGTIKGIAPKATLCDYRVLDEECKGCDDEILAQAIVEAVNDGCNILNISLGCSDTPIIRTAVEYAVSRGVLICSGKRK
eukprot:TRINITY_DN10903_c0_g1_i1.p1 TRINITY_DN10903_c0_g1~~TRINITY_DN10903_c0_g1_i1.p1  ORF type:complete len:137 (-),score=15.14 TRINITY_DN10903_c0_g1_i1:3-413(-)